MFKKAATLAILAFLLSSGPLQAQVTWIGPVLKQMAQQASKAVGWETGKSAVDAFKKLFNKNPDIAENKKGPQLRNGDLKNDRRNWVISPKGSLTERDISEIAETLKSLDHGKDQDIAVTMNNITQIYSTGKIDNIAGHHFPITGNTGQVVVNIYETREPNKEQRPPQTHSLEEQGASLGAPPPPTSSHEVDKEKKSHAKTGDAPINLLMSAWENVWVENGASAKVRPSNGSLYVNIRNPGKAFYDVQVYSYGQTLEPDHKYQLKLTAQSNKECDVSAKFHLYQPPSDKDAQEPQFCQFHLVPGFNELQEEFTSLGIKKNIRFTIYYGNCDADTEITITALELVKILSR